MYAFLSYHHEDKVVAGEIREFLSRLNIGSFLAHEDIEISHEWQDKILEELGKADLFFAVLSARYLASTYCLQESGIAIFRRINIVPLSIDESIPPGFLRHIQSRRINPNQIDRAVLLAGVARKDRSLVIDNIISMVEKSGSYRSAEGNFELVLPYVEAATEEQIVRLLKVSASNGQIWDASLCAKQYLPPLVAKYGHLLPPHDKDLLEKSIAAHRRL